jgi:hypothetical protein
MKRLVLSDGLLPTDTQHRHWQKFILDRKGQSPVLGYLGNELRTGNCSKLTVSAPPCIS